MRALGCIGGAALLASASLVVGCKSRETRGVELLEALAQAVDGHRRDCDEAARQVGRLRAERGDDWATLEALAKGPRPQALEARYSAAYSSLRDASASCMLSAAFREQKPAFVDVPDEEVLLVFMEARVRAVSAAGTECIAIADAVEAFDVAYGAAFDEVRARVKEKGKADPAADKAAKERFKERLDKATSPMIKIFARCRSELERVKRPPE